jgi:hypothetical protein
VVLPAAQVRSPAGHQAGEDREDERDLQPMVEGPGDQVGEERAASQELLVGGTQLMDGRSEQLLDRVEAQ